MSELPFLVLWSYGLITNRQRAFCPEFSVSHKVKVYRGLPTPSTVKLAKKFCTFCAELYKKTHRCNSGAQNQLFLIGKMTAWVIRASPEGLPCVISSLSYPHNKLSAASRTSPSSIRLNDWILLCLNVSYMGVFLPAACFCEIHKYCIKCIHFLI